MCLKWNSLDEKCVQSKFSQSVNPPSLCLLEPGCPSVDVVLPLAGPEESPHGETEQRKSWVCLHPTHTRQGGFPVHTTLTQCPPLPWQPWPTSLLYFPSRLTT